MRTASQKFFDTTFVRPSDHVRTYEVEVTQQDIIISCAAWLMVNLTIPREVFLQMNIRPEQGDSYKNEQRFEWVDNGTHMTIVTQAISGANSGIPHTFEFAKHVWLAMMEFITRAQRCH